MAEAEAYERLIQLLEAGKAQYRIIEHAPEGRTDIVSPLRGHPVNEAAKCLILMVKIGKKITKFILAVVPGDARVDLDAIKRLKNATFVRFAEISVAERMAGCVSGTILPFSFDPALELIVDSEVAKSKTMYFNAGRLDRSLALDTADYLRLVSPGIERIASRATASSAGRAMY
jgi:Ala-tRNA(Pro) deacylase